MVFKLSASWTKLTWKLSPVSKPLEGIVTDVEFSPPVLVIVILLRMLTNWDCMASESEEGARKRAGTREENTHF